MGDPRPRSTAGSIERVKDKSIETLSSMKPPTVLLLEINNFIISDI